MTAALHQGYVQKIQEFGWYAHCPTCGCDGFPDHDSREAAQRDVDAHYAAKVAEDQRHTSVLLAGCEASAAPPSEVPLAADASEPTRAIHNDDRPAPPNPVREEGAGQEVAAYRD